MRPVFNRADDLATKTWSVRVPQHTQDSANGELYLVFLSHFHEGIEGGLFLHDNLCRWYNFHDFILLLVVALHLIDEARLQTYRLVDYSRDNRRWAFLIFLVRCLAQSVRLGHWGSSALRFSSCTRGKCSQPQWPTLVYKHSSIYVHSSQVKFCCCPQLTQSKLRKLIFAPPRPVLTTFTSLNVQNVAFKPPSSILLTFFGSFLIEFLSTKRRRIH